MLRRDGEPDKEVRDYVKDRYASALQLIKNIEQKQTILKVCPSSGGNLNSSIKASISVGP